MPVFLFPPQGACVPGSEDTVAHPRAYDRAKTVILATVKLQLEASKMKRLIFDEDHEIFRDSVRRFMQSEVTPNV
jgi:hypothetical protein